MTAERVAHAICPHCYPDDPPEGHPTERLCGVTLPAESVPDGVRPALCPACGVHGRRCPTCRAVSTLIGMIPADDPKADTWATEPR